MQKAFLLSACFVICGASSAFAQTFVTAEGVRYQAACNVHGAVLSPVDPARVPIYLGNTCEAYMPGIGAGTWGWANGGFVARIEGVRIPFGRQDPPCWDDPRLAQAVDQCTEVP